MVIKKLFEAPEVNEKQKNLKVSNFFEKFYELNNVKVFEQELFTGKYRGMAHQACNGNDEEPTFIPIIVHNSTKYDIPLFIQKKNDTSESDDNLLVNTSPAKKEIFTIFPR